MSKQRTFAADFETTVYDGQEFTEVWAAACVELDTEDVKIFGSIGEQFDYWESLKCNIRAYYHNLKFDGEYWLAYLLRQRGFKQAGGTPDDYVTWNWDKKQRMPSNSFSYSISAQGQWYRMLIKVGRYYIEIRDSLKLLPFSLKAVGESFKTKHQKLDMEYEGFRYAGCPISPDERDYIKNDVLVLKEALEVCYSQGHDKLTIGSCALSEYRESIGRWAYDEYHPNLYEMEIDRDVYGSPTAGDYVRNSYRGGWCYLVPEKRTKILHNGTTADVNSLYPSMMSSESGNYYPVGSPHFWQGNYIPDVALNDDAYFFVRVRTRFYTKPNHLPCIQIKSTLLYKPREQLTSSDVEYEGKYYPYYKDFEGNLVAARPTMTWTQTDYYLYKEQYDFEDFEILDGCWFRAEKGIFDPYIEKYRKIKMESKGALRTLAKLFLNSLYGKHAASTDSSFKVAWHDKDKDIVRYLTIVEKDKKPGYIPVGSAITSYSRAFTIRAAQKNFYGGDKPGFVYADTDSIHCDLPADKIVGVKVHPTDFCAWKLESYWDIGWFVRAKTYIEHVTHEDGELAENPYYVVKCAGMPERSKKLFLASIGEGNPPEKLTNDELDFLGWDCHSNRRRIEDFQEGIEIPGKLIPRRIPGGVVLTPTMYVMH